MSLGGKLGSRPVRNGLAAIRCMPEGHAPTSCGAKGGFQDLGPDKTLDKMGLNGENKGDNATAALPESGGRRCAVVAPGGTGGRKTWR